MADGGQAQQQQVSPTSATQAAAAADAGQAPPSSDPHQQQQQQWAPPDPSAGFAEWEQYVERQLSQLPALQLLGADCAAVAACLQRHYRAFVPVTQLAAASLGDWSMFDQGQAQLSLDLATAGSLVGRGAATPDAALQICLSRSSSALEGLVSPRGAPSSSKRASEAGAVNPGQRGGQTQQPESNAARRASSGGLSRLSAHLQQLRVHRRSSNAGPSSTAASFTSSQHPFQHQQPQGEQQQGLLGASWDLVVAEGDRCKAVAVCSGSQYALVGTGRHRPLVYVTHKSGMGAASVAAPPDEVPPPSATAAAAAAQNSLLSGLMQQMLDHVRWPPDPWVIGEYPTRRSHSFGAAAMAQVSCCALAAHPLRPLYVSGSASGHIYMWCYGDAHSRAAYIPVTAQVCGWVWGVWVGVKEGRGWYCRRGLWVEDDAVGGGGRGNACGCHRPAFFLCVSHCAPAVAHPPHPVYTVLFELTYIPPPQPTHPRHPPHPPPPPTYLPPRCRAVPRYMRASPPPPGAPPPPCASAAAGHASGAWGRAALRGCGGRTLSVQRMGWDMRSGWRMWRGEVVWTWISWGTRGAR